FPVMQEARGRLACQINSRVGWPEMSQINAWATRVESKPVALTTQDRPCRSELDRLLLGYQHRASSQARQRVRKAPGHHCPRCLRGSHWMTVLLEPDLATRDSRHQRLDQIVRCPNTICQFQHFSAERFELDHLMMRVHDECSTLRLHRSQAVGTGSV